MACITIGDKITLKKGNMKGVVRYVGALPGKYGVWYGVELQHAKGEHNGSVRNVAYFTAKRNRGVFIKNHEISLTDQTGNDAPRISVGDKVRVEKYGCNGVVRFIGETHIKSGIWYGVELKKPVGKHNGVIQRREYFHCKWKHGVFVAAAHITTDRDHKHRKRPKKDEQERQEPGDVNAHADHEEGKEEHKEEVDGNIPAAFDESHITIHDTVQLSDNKLMGTVRFIGTLMHKSGIVYGIELKGDKGDNDGSLSNVRYFECSANQTQGVFVEKSSIEKRINIIESGDARITIHDTVRVKNINCNGVVRFIGSVRGKDGIFYGIELCEEKGKNNGSIGGRIYFACEAKKGIFVRKTSITKLDGAAVDNAAQVEDMKTDVDESPKKYTYKAPATAAYVVDYQHVHTKIRECTDELKMADKEHDSHKLLSMLDNITVGDKELQMWANYSGGRLFSNKSDAKNRLKTVVEYVEKDASCSAHIRRQLRLITKLICEKGVQKSEEYVHILLLLASHGNVCNVMKEVAIGNAYGMMTDKLDEFVQQQSLHQQVYKVLRDFRVLLVEELYHSGFGFTNNTHYIAGFHNALAEHIGIARYNDEHEWQPSSKRCTNWRRNLDQRYFGTKYTKKRIVFHILEQIKQQKISYQKIVQLMQDRCPPKIEPMEFLQLAIDIDSGAIRTEYICWMLKELNVFAMKPKNWQPIKKSWDKINQ